jgi:hypothetical protein
MVNKNLREIRKLRKPSIEQIKAVFFAREAFKLTQTADVLQSAGLHQDAAENRFIASLAEKRVAEALETFRPHVLDVN